MSHPWEAIYRKEGRVFQEPFHGFAQVLEVFRTSSCRRILDLGCGNGRHVVALARAGLQAAGVDISATALRLTRDWLAALNLEADTVAADMRVPLPFGNASFDGILSTQVIHHALAAQVRGAIGEIHRVLVPGGMAFVTVAGRTHADTTYQEIEPGTFIPLSGSEQGLPHHIFSESELRAEFSAFKVHEVSRRAEGKVLAVWAEK